MNLYEITIKRTYCEETVHIAARSPQKAIELTEKFGKKKYYSDVNIVALRLEKKIDAVQK